MSYKKNNRVLLTRNLNLNIIEKNSSSTLNTRLNSSLSKDLFSHSLSQDNSFENSIDNKFRSLSKNSTERLLKIDLSKKSFDKSQKEISKAKIVLDNFNKLKVIKENKEKVRIFKEVNFKTIDYPKYDNYTSPEEEIKKDEQAVKLLNEWDRDNIQFRDNKGLYFRIPTNKKIQPKTAELSNNLDSINYLNKMIVATKRKNSPDRYKLKGLFPQLQKNNNFNFSVFTSVSEEKINLNTENISNTMIIENLVIKHFDSQQNTSYYRDIVREKIKIENIFRKDLIQVAEKVLMKKIEKKRVREELSKLIKSMMQAKEDFEECKQLYEEKKRKLNEEMMSSTREPSKEMSPVKSSLVTSPLQRTSKRKRSTIKMDPEFITRTRTNTFFNDKLIEKQLLLKNFEIKKEYYDNHIKNLNTEIESVKKRITYLEIDIRLYNVHFDNMVKDQTTYYLDIISVGMDVRFDGLNWAVKRLIELNANFDYNNFPKILDNEQIDYLITLSYYQIEYTQMIDIVNRLKIRKQKTSEEEQQINKHFLETLTSFNSKTNSGPPKSGLAFMSRASPDGGGTSYEFKTVSRSSKMLIGQLNKKYDIMLIKEKNQQLTENLVDNVISCIKDKVLNYPKTGILLGFRSVEEENLFNLFFKTNQSSKDDFDLIIKIKEKLSECEHNAKNLKENFKTNFKKKFKYLKDNSLTRQQYDVKYACLFGNGIVL